MYDDNATEQKRTDVTRVDPATAEYLKRAAARAGVAV